MFYASFSGVASEKATRHMLTVATLQKKKQSTSHKNNRLYENCICFQQEQSMEALKSFSTKYKWNPSSEVQTHGNFRHEHILESTIYRAVLRQKY